MIDVMSSRSLLVSVDGRQVVLARDRVPGRAVLASVGAKPARGDILIRDHGGRARYVAPVERLELDPSDVVTFRVHRDGTVRRLEVDGRAWDWGTPSISEKDIRSIIDLEEDEDLFTSDGREVIRRGSLIELPRGERVFITSGRLRLPS